MASIVGAIPTEIAVMNSLTVNLHLLLIRFMSHFSPASKRSKILVEAKLFPSDLYAIESELRLHGFEHPADCIEYVHPRKGEFTIRTEDIISRIDELGDALAIVMFSGVQFYTGQLFDIPTITRAAHSVGAKAIWDLAHAAGNVDLYLHDWQVDGACWCSYKYLNGGPGGVGGFFIHENHFNRVHADRLLGWWSHNVLTRFEMSNEYDASLGASEFRLSNVPILSSAALLASLDVFGKTSMPLLRAKSILLTNYLEILLNQLAINEESSTIKFQIITCKSRGAQLSILFESDDMARSINRKLEKNGVMVDYRKPGLIRAAPAPLYCSFSDVFDFYEKFKLAFIDV
jgi:kynureninase